MTSYAGPIIDSDVHHNWKTDEEIISRLPAEWRNYVLSPGGGRRLPIRSSGFAYAHPRGGVNKRLETFPADGSPAASDYGLLKEQLLDRFHVERAILAYDLISSHAALPNPEFANALIRAINDWVVEGWLSINDDRLCGVVFIPVETPDVGAAEIRRMARHARVAEARLPWTLGKPFGHPIYDPIYKAAVENGLPVSLHIHGGESQGGLAHHNAAGRANTFLEFHALLAQPTFHHVASLVTHGVFERFPDLKFLLVETGVAWIPWLLWALDSQYENLKRESAWVKRLPSEYFRDHIRVTTQPLELTDEPGQLIELLEAFGGLEDVLCFSSDYPHWDFDDPRYIAGKLPTSWHRKVFYENAQAFYGDRLGHPSVAASGRPS
jgi:predicted TIM-barrel fold metal-dependent hydrolase